MYHGQVASATRIRVTPGPRTQGGLQAPLLRRPRVARERSEATRITPDATIHACRVTLVSSQRMTAHAVKGTRPATGAWRGDPLAGSPRRRSRQAARQQVPYSRSVARFARMASLSKPL